MLAGDKLPQSRTPDIPAADVFVPVDTRPCRPFRVVEVNKLHGVPSEMPENFIPEHLRPLSAPDIVPGGKGMGGIDAHPSDQRSLARLP